MKKVTARSPCPHARQPAARRVFLFSGLPAKPIESMNSNHTPERFPILTIFCLVFLGFHISLSVAYFWVTQHPPNHVVSLALARVFVASGLPDNSIVPLLVEGRHFTARQWLDSAHTSAGAATLRASDWMLFYIPIFAVFLATLSIWTGRRWRKSKPLKVLRGVQVIRR